MEISMRSVKNGSFRDMAKEFALLDRNPVKLWTPVLKSQPIQKHLMRGDLSNTLTQLE